MRTSGGGVDSGTAVGGGGGALHEAGAIGATDGTFDAKGAGTGSMAVGSTHDTARGGGGAMDSGAGGYVRAGGCEGMRTAGAAVPLIPRLEPHIKQIVSVSMDGNSQLGHNFVVTRLYFG